MVLKIVQVAVLPAGSIAEVWGSRNQNKKVHEFPHQVFALCDDGSLWTSMTGNHANPEWEEFDPIDLGEIT